MPKKSYALEPGGAERVTLRWKAFWKNLKIEFDGQEVGTIPNQKELRRGQTFALSDGSDLEVKLAQKWASAELQVLRNGQPLPGSGSDPRSRLKQSYGILYFLAGFNLILGLAALLFQIDFLLEMGLGIYSAIIGCLYLVLAIFVHRRSQVALLVAMGLYGFETLLSVIGGLGAGIIVRILFLVLMSQGFGAIKALQAESENAIEPID